MAACRRAGDLSGRPKRVGGGSLVSGKAVECRAENRVLRKAACCSCWVSRRLYEYENPRLTKRRYSALEWPSSGADVSQVPLCWPRSWRGRLPRQTNVKKIN